mmetsp:Transcript_9494/g.14144  ORF Transcript_9494/g.14144 Transcript_9494/m.14144 type:complete len:378 (+) Transcript_9494:130-1263(+)
MLSSQPQSQSYRPLFTLQRHSSLINTNHINTDGKKAQSDEGKNGVTCVTFLHHGRSIIRDSDDDSDDDDDDDVPIFQCRSRLLLEPQQRTSSQLQQSRPKHDRSTVRKTGITSTSTSTSASASTSTLTLTSAAIDQAATLTFSNNKTFLASCHANGEAFIWDLNKRRVAFPLVDGDNDNVRLRLRGPGLSVVRLINNEVGTNSFSTSENDVGADTDTDTDAHDNNGNVNNNKYYPDGTSTVKQRQKRSGGRANSNSNAKESNTSTSNIPPPKWCIDAWHRLLNLPPPRAYSNLTITQQQQFLQNIQNPQAQHSQQQSQSQWNIPIPLLGIDKATFLRSGILFPPCVAPFHAKGGHLILMEYVFYALAPVAILTQENQ